MASGQCAAEKMRRPKMLVQLFQRPHPSFLFCPNTSSVVCWFPAGKVCIEWIELHFAKKQDVLLNNITL